MKNAYVIKKAILSEKAYGEMKKGIYHFLVDQRATKHEIAKQVATQFSVEVKKVSVLTIKPKTKRIAKTRNFFTLGGGKKAIVYLKSGQTISLLSPSAKEDKKEKSKKSKPETKKLEGERK